MALVWHDAKSFQRHLEAMRAFRQSHRGTLKNGFTLPKQLPAPGKTCPLSATEAPRSFSGMRGKRIVVPIWEVVLSRNAQN